MEQPTTRQHDLVVIGASAGGVEALRCVVSGLPANLRATVCIVLHLAPSSPSALASILRRAGPLPCRTAVDGERLQLGEILVAPPDRHLVIEDGRVRLTIGPRENGHRPAVDVLFRSAAAARPGRVIGVILSGTQDDGSAGLAVIKACGGAAIVQDPKDAVYAGMPTSALASVSVDAVVPAAFVARTVVTIVNGQLLPSTGPGDAGQDPPRDRADHEVEPPGGEQPPAGVGVLPTEVRTNPSNPGVEPGSNPASGTGPQRRAGTPSNPDSARHSNPGAGTMPVSDNRAGEPGSPSPPTTDPGAVASCSIPWPTS